MKKKSIENAFLKIQSTDNMFQNLAVATLKDGSL